MDKKMEVYYELILKLTNYLNHKADDNLCSTLFQIRLLPYLRVATPGMKQDTLFFHKKVVVTCKESMGDANEYQKLLEPPPKLEKNGDSMKSELVCDQCQKSSHTKKLCH